MTINHFLSQNVEHETMKNKESSVYNKAPIFFVNLLMITNR